jgi:hypothetical protein
MDALLHGDLAKEGFEVVRRTSRLFIRYDAGSHLEQWREDEISEEELCRLSIAPGGYDSVRFDIQRRLIASGIDPYVANWTPSR